MWYQPSWYRKVMWWWRNRQWDTQHAHGHLQVSWSIMFLVNLFNNFLLRTLSMQSNFVTCLLSGLMVLAFSICWLIKDASVKPLDEQFSILSLAQKTFRLIIEDKRQLFLIPLTIFSGNSLSFIADTFNFSFVTCGFGPQWIGAVMIAFGSRKAFDCLG